MQININNMTIDWEFKKASRYLPVRLSTTYFDGIGECICIVANRADGMTSEIIENHNSEVFLTINNPSLYNTVKSAVLNMDFWAPNTHYNTVTGFADGIVRKIHLDGMIFLTDAIMNELAKDFPFSKDELGNIIMTVELLIMNVCKNASKKYPTQILQIQRGIYGIIDEVCGENIMDSAIRKMLWVCHLRCIMRLSKLIQKICLYSTLMECHMKILSTHLVLFQTPKKLLRNWYIYIAIF